METLDYIEREIKEVKISLGEGLKRDNSGNFNHPLTTDRGLIQEYISGVKWNGDEKCRISKSELKEIIR